MNDSSDHEAGGRDGHAFPPRAERLPELDPGDARLLEGKKIIVVMPAYNAARTLRMTWEAIPKEWVDLVILVDDHSADDTLAVARELSLDIVAHPHNVGYGGNQKTCYIEALRSGADVVVMLHPDGQYDPSLIPSLTRPILEDRADMVLGSRFLSGGTLAGGMPRYKYIGNRFLTTVENRTLGIEFSELHTGYRAYSRQFLETIPFMRNANDFSFDTEVIAQAVAFDQRVLEVPVSTRYFDDASSTTFSQSVVYGLETLMVMARFALHRAGIWKSRRFAS
jgi:glycosyltransferase involved in cell wall biosynthesis